MKCSKSIDIQSTNAHMHTCTHSQTTKTHPHTHTHTHTCTQMDRKSHVGYPSWIDGIGKVDGIVPSIVRKRNREPTKDQRAERDRDVHERRKEEKRR